jgi:cytochrome c-type biogenesis protein
MAEAPTVGLAVAFAAGMVSFLSPCVLPLVPSYLTFVTGMSLEDLEEGVNRKTTLLHSLLFVLGFSTIFVISGAAASFLGMFIRQNIALIAQIGGVVIIILGLHLSGVLRLTPLLRERRVHLSEKPAGYIGTVGVGIAFAAGWTPCLSPTLGALLTLGATQETMWAGVGLLGMYSLGLAVPFLLASLALDRFLQAFKRFRRWMGIVEMVSGVLLIFLGILLVTGQMTRLSAWLYQFTPEWMLI